MKELEPNSFRCPFETKGKKENTIIERTLSSDSLERINLVTSSLAEFHKDLKAPGLIFKLPPELLERTHSLEELRRNIVPYQSEVLAAELSYRLYPFLPFQYKSFSQEQLIEFSRMRPYKVDIVRSLLEISDLEKSNFIISPQSIAHWIQDKIERGYERGAENPNIKIFNPSDAFPVAPQIIIFPSSIEIGSERIGTEKDPTLNQNCFGIVRAPFYPKEFGRHSDDIEIVFSREADFVALPDHVREKIRTHSNTVLQEGGVIIEDVKEDKQSDGVWIPDYKEGP